MRDVLLDRSTQHGRWPDVLGLLFVGAFFGILPTLAVIASQSVQPLEWVVFGPFAAIPFIAVLVAGIHLFGSELLVLEGSRLHSSRSAGPWSQAWSVALEDITLLRVPGLGREFMKGAWGVGVPALVVKTRVGTRRCCFAVHPQQAEAIASTIRSAMAERARGMVER